MWKTEFMASLDPPRNASISSITIILYEESERREHIRVGVELFETDLDAGREYFHRDRRAVFGFAFHAQLLVQSFKELLHVSIVHRVVEQHPRLACKGGTGQDAVEGDCFSHAGRAADVQCAALRGLPNPP